MDIPLRKGPCSGDLIANAALHNPHISRTYTAKLLANVLLTHRYILLLAHKIVGKIITEGQARSNDYSLYFRYNFASNAAIKKYLLTHKEVPVIPHKY